MKLYTGYSVSGLNIIYLRFNDTDSDSDHIAGVATTRLGTSLVRLAQVACKKIIQIVYMFTRLAVNGVLQRCLKEGDSVLNEINLLYLDEQAMRKYRAFHNVRRDYKHL
jgi:hypothetical protein